MGITIVQKSDLSKKKSNVKTALVLAGGAVSGGAFKAGGLKALNDFLVNRKVTDFDLYVGISAGGFLAVPLAGGISPEEILKSLDGTSHRFEQLSPFHLYSLNWKEFLERPLSFLQQSAAYFPEVFVELLSYFPSLSGRFAAKLRRFFQRPTYSRYEQLMQPIARSLFSAKKLPSPLNLIPSGFFDNRKIEEYIRKNSRKNRMPNNFKALKRLSRKELYICGMELDTSARVVFGWDERNDITISEAVMASTALPGFYKPARVKGVDYIDGGVLLTADIDLAIEKGAELIICYNPFRPFKNVVNLEYVKEREQHFTEDRRISDNGFFSVLNQVFRAFCHSRLAYGIQKYQQDENFKGDIILIEPNEDDFTFFDINPFAFWNRAKAAKHGFQSVKESIEQDFEKISTILAAYGITMTREIVAQDEAKIQKAAHDQEVLTVLEEEPARKGRFRLIAGGRKVRESTS